MGRPAIDLTGMRFGHLVVIKRSRTQLSTKNAIWVVRCDCGRKKTIGGNYLRNPKFRTGHAGCGCFGSQFLHGHTYTKTYGIWSKARSRCRNATDPAWEYYGGRGIKFCERWNDFTKFLEDMGECPPKMTLDRYPDNDGNYEPGNCRWATMQQQGENKRPYANNTSGHTGVYLARKGIWRALIAVERKRIHIGYFRSKEAAIQARIEAAARYGRSH